MIHKAIDLRRGLWLVWLRLLVWQRLLAWKKLLAWKLLTWQKLVLALGIVASGLTAQADETAVRADIRERTFVAEFDDSQQKYVVIQPPGLKPGQPVSLVVALHGHGSDRWQFIRQSRGECRGVRHVAHARGMMLISPDYRATQSWMGPAATSDVRQIILMTKKIFQVQHVILCGGSMGGTGALTFTALHPELVDGVVALNGTANLVEYERFQDAIAASFGGSKKDVPQQYHKRSAEFFPQRFTMPLAATTGGRDATVPADSVLRLIARLADHNSDVLSIHRAAGGHQTTYDDTKRALEFVIEAVEKRDRARAELDR